MKRLRVEQNDMLAELAKGKAKLKKLEEEKMMEAEGLKNETTSKQKA